MGLGFFLPLCYTISFRDLSFIMKVFFQVLFFQKISKSDLSYDMKYMANYLGKFGAFACPRLLKLARLKSGVWDLGFSVKEIFKGPGR